MSQCGDIQAAVWRPGLPRSYSLPTQPNCIYSVAGAALGGVIGSLETCTNTTNKGPFAGLIVAGANGLAREYPDVADLT